MRKATISLAPRTSTLAQQEADFTAEGSPAPGKITRSVYKTLPECLAVLETVKSSLAEETGRRRRLEREVLNVRAALERARADLAGTQAGEQHARHLALHDGLTSLPNRRFFRERLEQAVERRSPLHPALAVVYLDLDDFKPVNDQYGHDAGDEVLRIVARRLARTVRSEDMMSRLGGDEFACLPADFDSVERLTRLASKLFDAVSAPLKLGGLTLTIRPSIGIATCPADGRSADALLKSADAAMYRAKREQTRYAFRERVSRLNTASNAAPEAAAISMALTGSSRT
ncbi:MAG: GGDEF domain-containing protein [Gammaproteobacteria bacterium]